MASTALTRSTPRPPAKQQMRVYLPSADAEPPVEEVAVCYHAATRCSTIIAGFAVVMPGDLLKPTRGSADQAFVRQVFFAGLVMALGFEPRIVAKAIGRDKQTVEHACKVIGSLRNAELIEIVRILGEAGVREFFDGAEIEVVRAPPKTDARGRIVAPGEIIDVLRGDEVEEFIEGADRLIAKMFSAFELVAVAGPAYCAEVKRRKMAMAR